MLPVPGNHSDLLTVLLERIKLVRKRSLDLLSRNIRQLRFSNETLRLGPNELLLEHNDLGRVGVLVFKLRNLVGNFLLPCGALVCGEMWGG